MKAYIAYIRVSTVKQGAHNTSLQEQRSAIEAYALRNNLIIQSWHEEQETAAKRGRRVFNQVLTSLRRGQAAGLIVHKIDRSARNLKDWSDLQELLDRGIEVHFAHESLDMGTRGGRLAADIQAVVAADYIRNLRDEAKKGIEGRLKQGIYPFAAPRGYLDRGGGKPKIIDSVDGPLVRQAFELYASGRYNLHMLRDEMYRRGLCGRAGLRLSINALATVLHNPFYTGVIHIKRTDTFYQGIHEPLISRALFDHTQAVAAGRVFGRPQKHSLAYRRLIRCGLCGYALIGERQKGHVYYRCHSRTCHGTSLREEAVDAAMRLYLRLISYSEEDLRDLRELLLAETQDAARRAEIRRLAAMRRLDEIEDRLSRLTDAFLDHDIDRDTFQARKGRLLADRRTTQDELEGVQTDAEGAALLKNLELANMAQLQFEIENSDEKREAVKFTTSNLWAVGKCLEFKPSFPFEQIAIQRNRSCGDPFRIVPRKEGNVFIASDDCVLPCADGSISRSPKHD